MPSELEQLRHSLSVYKGLVEVSALINAITDFDQLLPAILDVARRVMRAEASSLFLVNAGGDLELVVARGEESDVPVQQIVVPRGRGISGWVFENSEALLVPDAYADSRFYREVDRQSGFRTRSILCAPLTRDGADIGVLQVLNPVGKTAFDEADLDAFCAYANLAATAIDKLRAFDRRREAERIEREFAIATEIQHSFLPQTLPSLPRLSFAATYRPALNIGGDFYDVVQIGPDEIYFVVGDVSGKGTPAALLMAQSLSTLRLIIQPGISTGDALTRWNDMLCGHTIRGMFITTLLGRIVPSARRMELSTAGHCAPYRISPGAKVEAIQLAGAPPIGILGGMPHACQTFTFEPGEKFCAFTDGLTESFSPEGELLDTTGVSALLARDFSCPSDVIGELLRGERQHRGEADPNDDLTILVCSFQ